MLLHQFGHLGDVGLLGIVLGHALAPIPCLPLGLALEVQQAGFVGVAVADGGLFVKAVNF